MPEGDARVHARQPAARRILRRMWREAVSDRISLVAAGCAFYALLALFPAISLLVNVYGLVFDPRTVEPQLEFIRRFLTADTYALIDARLRDLVATERPQLEAGAVVSALIAFWSAGAGVRGMLGALNMAFDSDEERGFLAFHLTALMLTMGAILATVLGIAVLVFLPQALALIGVPTRGQLTLRVVSFALLYAFAVIAIAMLYRFGPARPLPGWRLFSPGALFAASAWLAASALFSIYVSHWASYDSMYGPLGAAVGLLMWFYITVFLVLLGAELDSECMAVKAEHLGNRPPVAGVAGAS